MGTGAPKIQNLVTFVVFPPRTATLHANNMKFGMSEYTMYVSTCSCQIWPWPVIGGHRSLQSSTVGQNRVISAVVRPTIKNDVKFGIEEGWIKIAVFFSVFQSARATESS